MSKNIGRISGSPSPARARIGREVAARLEADPSIKRANTDAAQIYTYPGFLSDRECDMLVRLIDSAARPSTLLATHDDPEFRTSNSTDLDRWSDAVWPIDDRIALLLGIAPENAETMQGQRYLPGQQFRAHCDYFHENADYWERMRETGGQRTWTAMVYLNHVEEGGATWFPSAGVRFKARKGLMLIWNNMSADGSPNYNTLHEGMRVVAGKKYVITKWFRENAWIKGHVPTYVAGDAER